MSSETETPRLVPVMNGSGRRTMKVLEVDPGGDVA